MNTLLQNEETIMDKRELLKKFLEMASHNLLCYSKNMLQNCPRPGFEYEWEQARHECELLQEMINEYPYLKGNFNTFEIVGTIKQLSCKPSQALDDPSIEYLIIKDRDGNNRLFLLEDELGKEIIDIFDSGRHRRILQGKDDTLVFTVENFTQKIKKWEWKVR